MLTTRGEARASIAKTCGEGWLELVDFAYDNRPHHVTIVQVYQKWGALRFDIQPPDDEFAALLEKIESRSLEICECCGAPAGEVILDGWVLTRCPAHGTQA